MGITIKTTNKILYDWFFTIGLNLDEMFFLFEINFVRLMFLSEVMHSLIICNTVRQLEKS